MIAINVIIHRKPNDSFDWIKSRFHLKIIVLRISTKHTLHYTKSLSECDRILPVRSFTTIFCLIRLIENFLSGSWRIFFINFLQIHVHSVHHLVAVNKEWKFYSINHQSFSFAFFIFFHIITTFFAFDNRICLINYFSILFDCFDRLL